MAFAKDFTVMMSLNYNYSNSQLHITVKELFFWLQVVYYLWDLEGAEDEEEKPPLTLYLHKEDVFLFIH